MNSVIRISFFIFYDKRIDQMLELLWQLGILSAVLVFGVKIGLAMGFANISKKTAVAIAAGYGAGIFILASLLTGYTDIVYKIFYEYNFVIFLLMSIVISYAGFHTIREWKVNHKNHAKASCAAMIAPCPCCFGAIVTATVIASPTYRSFYRSYWTICSSFLKFNHSCYLFCIRGYSESC